MDRGMEIYTDGGHENMMPPAPPNGGRGIKTFLTDYVSSEHRFTNCTNSAINLTHVVKHVNR